MKPSASSLLRRLARALLCAAFFLGGLSAVCAALARVTPFPEVSSISPKMRFFVEKHAHSEVIFVGSSRVIHQIIPARFDAAVAAAGRPVSSFNFGQDGTWPPESFYVLRRLLKLPAPHLRWVFIELTNLDGLLRDNVDETTQARYWHDRHHTNLAEQALLSGSCPWTVKLPMLWRHEALWLRRATNYGSGAPMLRRTFWADRPRQTPPGWTQRAGYRPEPKRGLTGSERDGFLRSLAQVQDELAAQRTPMPDALRAELRALIALIRARGAEPVFFISPGLNGKFNFAEAPDGARLISFCRPDLYPELYRPEYYFDLVHLNPDGAEVYTDLMAKKFVELFSGRP